MSHSSLKLTSLIFKETIPAFHKPNARQSIPPTLVALLIFAVYTGLHSFTFLAAKQQQNLFCFANAVAQLSVTLYTFLPPSSDWNSKVTT